MNQQFPSVFRAEAFRAFLVLFIPGALAVFPWVLLANAAIPELASYRLKSEPVYFFGLFCVAISVGMLIENVGSMIEVMVWDRKLERDDSLNFRTVWDSFLGLQHEHESEPIGHRYLRSVLMRTLFVTHFAIATSLAAIGTLANVVTLGVPTWAVFSWICWLSSALVVWLMFESYAGCRVLAKTRKILVERELSEPLSEQAVSKHSVEANGSQPITKNKSVTPRAVNATNTE